jgi:hypothetical protein
VLAFYLAHFVPLAVASLGLSVGSCALAAIQANLPRHKRSIWSRPLVALLFFLQPIVRGWARFKWRISLLSGRTESQVELPPVSAAKEMPERITYWSDGRVDRFQFLTAILAKLDRAGWTYRTDTGWTSHDVEVLAHVWIRLRLTTVSEDLGHEKKNFFCRIHASWSLPARILLVLTVLGIVLVLTSLVEQHPWAWMSLMVLPLVTWIVEDEALHQQKTLAALIKLAATERSMIETNDLS